MQMFEKYEKIAIKTVVRYDLHMVTIAIIKNKTKEILIRLCLRGTPIHYQTF